MPQGAVKMLALGTPKGGKEEVIVLISPLGMAVVPFYGGKHPGNGNVGLIPKKISSRGCGRGKQASQSGVALGTQVWAAYVGNLAEVGAHDLHLPHRRLILARVHPVAHVGPYREGVDVATAVGEVGHVVVGVGEMKGGHLHHVTRQHVQYALHQAEQFVSRPSKAMR